MLRRLFSLYAPPRSTRFAQLTDAHVQQFTRMLGSAAVVQTDLTPYNKDYLSVYVGHSSLLLRPRSPEEVAAVLKYCTAQHIAVCPQSGNTGLVGGSVPVHDEVILHMGGMASILDFDEELGVVLTEAGVVLETLNNYCEERNYIVPLDLGAKGSCMIGGNIATNAGGIRFLRYGSMHANVVGLEAVTATGEILNTLSRNRNPGFDLGQLFIGSEGTLGVVTKAKVQLAPKPTNKQVAFLACASFEDVLKALALSRKHLSEVLSAFEFLERNCVDIVLDRTPGTTDPFSVKHPFYVLIETSGANADHDYSKLEEFLSEAMEECLVDGVLAQDFTQLRQFWKIRESVAVAATELGYRFVYDISLKHKYFMDIVDTVKAQMPDGTLTLGYGHVGDGNLHLTVIVKGKERDYDKIRRLGAVLEPMLFEYLANTKSSISAEHGVGLMKRSKLHISRSEAEIAHMKELKKVFDPAGILNPYKVIP